MESTARARTTRLLRQIAAAAVISTSLGGCEGVREISARAATRLAESLGDEAQTPTPSGPTTPSLSWAKNGFGAAGHELQVRAASGTRVFVGAQEETIGASGVAHFNLSEPHVVERADVQLVAPDGSITRVAMPEIPGPRLADVVRLTSCFGLDDALLVRSPALGGDTCNSPRDRVAFDMPTGARATLGGKTIAVEGSGATFTIDAAALALEHRVRLHDPISHRTSEEPDVAMPLRVQWRGQTLETTVELRFGKQVVDAAVRAAIGQFQGGTLSLPGSTDATPDARALVAVVADQARWIGKSGSLADVDLVAVHELLEPRDDGRCGPYGRFGFGTDYVPRKARDQRWTIHDARTRAVIATRTFKATRATCPYSVQLDDDTVVTADVSEEAVSKWLAGFARSS
jgi:hypothetical protein